jgi:hypothetical protein
MFILPLVVLLLSTNITAVKVSEVDPESWFRLLGYRSAKFELPLFNKAEMYMDVYRKDANYEKERNTLFTATTNLNMNLMKPEGYIAFAPLSQFIFQLYFETNVAAGGQTAIDFSSFFSDGQGEPKLIWWSRAPELVFENNSDGVETVVFVVVLDENPRPINTDVFDATGFKRLIDGGHDIIVVFGLRLN